MSTEALRRFVDQGLSVLVGTADAEGNPNASRAIALTASPDLCRATVYLPAVTSQQTIANIATTRRLAVLSAHPIDHGSVQVKGWSRTVRLARDDEAELIRARLSQFSEILEMVGLPRRITMSINYWPSFAVEFDVEEVFDQTPGPMAGSALS